MPNKHDHVNLPVLVGRRGGIRAGGTSGTSEPTPLANLHLTLLDRVGVRLDRFADSQGKVDGAAVKRAVLLVALVCAPVLLAQTSRRTGRRRCTGRSSTTTLKSVPSNSSTAGADVKAANRYGVTPLSLACTNGNAAMIELLLKAGADPQHARCRAARPP